MLFKKVSRIFLSQFNKISRAFLSRFGSEQWHGKRYVESVRSVNDYEEKVKSLSDEALRGKTAEFKAALAYWGTLEVREQRLQVRVRTLKQLARAIATELRSKSAGAALANPAQVGSSSADLKDTSQLPRDRAARLAASAGWPYGLEGNMLDIILELYGEDIARAGDLDEASELIVNHAGGIAHYVEQAELKQAIEGTIRCYAGDIAGGLLKKLDARAFGKTGTGFSVYRSARQKTQDIVRAAADGTTAGAKPNEIEAIIRQHARDISLALTEKEAETLIKTCIGKPQEILMEAFATVREVARRTVGMRHFDVQLAGGKVLYEGKITEMATGEGKTLVATLAAYLVHLSGRKVHIVTVNDYLAKRDAEWMGPVYRTLGLTVGAIQSDMDTSSEERRYQYCCDITYGTNNEFGFDYLRDNMKMSIEQMVQGPLQYAIIDEVDSILIDEARTPLIISGPSGDPDSEEDEYKEADRVARKLIALQRRKSVRMAQHSVEQEPHDSEQTQGEDLRWYEEAAQQEEEARIELAKVLRKASHEEISEDYYEVESAGKHVALTTQGVAVAQKEAGAGSFYTQTGDPLFAHKLEQALRAHLMYKQGHDYVVTDGKVIIVDEFTGRLMHGRQWSDGLHQAVEAKEGVDIKQETQTLGTVTLQNFFKLYGRIAGMTGTAATEAEEFMRIYNLDVVTIPTNRPCIREDMEDAIYKSWDEKFAAIIREIKEVSDAGRPVLVGTLSVKKSQALSDALIRNGVDHQVLNATQTAGQAGKQKIEAEIVAQAGQRYPDRHGKLRGNVTIATNMAGRGTDIILGGNPQFEAGQKMTKLYGANWADSPECRKEYQKEVDRCLPVWKKDHDEVVRLGGLHILGTERHESRRIDNQLRGRCARQGDPGSTKFFLSFQDDLIVVFAPEWMVKALDRLGWEEGQPIAHSRISKAIERAQKKVEYRNSLIRESLLQYDEVMNYQRNTFYSRRREALAGENLKGIVMEMIDSVVTKQTRKVLDREYPLRHIAEWAETNFNMEIKPAKLADASAQEIETLIKENAKDNAANNVALSIDEYLDKDADPSTWDVTGFTKWAMSTFHVNFSHSKVKSQSHDDIVKQLVSAAAQQIDRRNCSAIAEFLKDDFALRRFAEWVGNKFDIKLDVEELKGMKPVEVRELTLQRIADKYRRREIEYPVEFAMNMVYGPQGPNVYAFKALAEWANRKYLAGLSTEQIQNAKPRELRDQLLQLSEQFNDGKLEEEVTEKMVGLNTRELVAWANEWFNASLFEEDVSDGQNAKERLLEEGRRFLRSELADLERFVLLQVYDKAWKDHLYAMDSLKDSIWTRRFAEKDPRTEYKVEGAHLFNEMLDTIEDRVTDVILRVHVAAGTRARSVWNVSQTAHDEVSQFAMAEQQRAAAQAPQGEIKVKQIKLETPKVGRNDPCPCGSGKKYKKCCGKNT